MTRWKQAFQLPGESPTGPAAKISAHRGWDVGRGAQSKSETGPGPCPGHTLLSPITSPGIDLGGSEEREQAGRPGKAGLGGGVVGR